MLRAFPLAFLATMTLAQAASADPFQWLEDVGGEKPLAWARARNAVTEGELEAHPAYRGINDRVLAILDSKEKIPYVTKRGAHYWWNRIFTAERDVPLQRSANRI